MKFSVKMLGHRPGWTVAIGALALLVAVGAVATLVVVGFGYGGKEAVAPARVPAPRVVQKPPPKAAPHPPVVVAKPVATPEVSDAAAVFAEEQRMSSAQRMKRWDTYVAEASKKYSLPAKWIRAVIMAESAGRTMGSATRKIISTAGAMGLMQLMPQTYADMRRAHGLGADPYDPHDNIMAGSAYLHDLHVRYGYPAMFAAYNDGPGHLDERIANARLLPTETITYVERITGVLEGRGAHGMVTFTRPDGSPVQVPGAAVRSVRAALPGEYAETVRSVITVGAVQQGVREDLATARSRIISRGGAVSTKTRLVTRLVLACERSETDSSGGRITCGHGAH